MPPRLTPNQARIASQTRARNAEQAAEIDDIGQMTAGLAKYWEAEAERSKAQTRHWTDRFMAENESDAQQRKAQQQAQRYARRRRPDGSLGHPDE
jgi:hypothetical protein